MKGPAQILAEHRIPSGGRRSVYLTICPQCSHTRRKKKNKCLSVLIDGRGVRWNCHHCLWSGWEFYNEPRRPDTASKPVIVKQGTDDDDRKRNRRIAARIWRETVPLPGTLGEKYFVEHRNIDIRGLDLKHAVRWHGNKRMIVARMSDPLTNEGLGIHRTFLNEDGNKLERKMLGGSGVVRLWPDDAVEQGLVIGEGIETTLAAALNVELRGTLLQPAWATLTTVNLAPFPVLPGVETLTILVDNDASHAGQAAAQKCARRWVKAGREAILLIPSKVKDFNDLIKEAV